MASKTIISREKTAEALRGALLAHGAEAAEELGKALEPEVSPDVAMPEMEDFQILLRRRLDTARRGLVAADEAHLAVLRRLDALRVCRDSAVGELRRLLARLRNAVDGVYGPGSSADLLLLEGPTPRDPVVLRRTALRVVEHLEKQELPRPEDALAGIDLAPHLWLDLLRGPLVRLGDHLTAITLEKRDAVDALLAKNAAKKDYDRLYSATTRMLQEFFRYVGMDEMAGTIRPKRRKAVAAEPGPLEETPVEADLGGRDPSPSEQVPSPEKTMAQPMAASARQASIAASGTKNRHLALLPPPQSRDPAPGSRPSA